MSQDSSYNHIYSSGSFPSIQNPMGNKKKQKIQSETMPDVIIPTESQASVAVKALIRKVSESPKKIADFARLVTGTTAPYNSLFDAQNDVFNWIKEKKYSGDCIDGLIELHPDFEFFKKYFERHNTNTAKEKTLNDCGCSAMMVGCDGVVYDRYPKHLITGETLYDNGVNDGVTEPTKKLQAGTILAITGLFVVSLGLVASLLNDKK